MTRPLIVAAGTSGYFALALFCYFFHVRPGLPELKWDAEGPGPITSRNQATVSAGISHGGIRLRGVVRSAESHALVLEGARSVAGTGNVTDEIRIDTTVEEPIQLANLSKLLEHMQSAQWLNPSFTLTGRDLLLAGLAQEPDTVGTVLSHAAQLLPEAKVTSLISVTGGGVPNLIQGMIDKVLFARRVEFDAGGSTLRPEAVSLLERLVPLLAGSAYRVSIRAYTDTSMGDEEAHTLTQLRAEAVRQFFIERNIPAERLIAIGHGRSERIADNSTEAGRRRNNRVEFSLGL